MAIFNYEALSRLAKLLDIISPSMQEQEMVSWLERDWKTAAPAGRTRIDALGNLEFTVDRGADCPRVALMAHADTICVQITNKFGYGRYQFRPIGCSPHALLGQRVIVVNEGDQKYPGVIGFDATSQFGQPKGLVFEDLWIDLVNPDCCYSVHPGDLAVFEPGHHIDGNNIVGTSLDDRLGLFIIGEVLRRYSQSDAQVNLTCVASVQEEVGLRGSLGFKFTSEPDAVIVLDVDYATDTPLSHENQMGRLCLGFGPGVQRKADNSAAIRHLLETAATEAEQPLQLSLGRYLYGGTDSASLQADGLAVANLCIPCRYIHSPAEMASLSDVAAAIEIISKAIVLMSKA